MDKIKFCCEYFPKMAPTFHWFVRTDEKTKETFFLMPSIDYIDDSGHTQMARVQYCPSCGAYVRSIEISAEQYKEEILKR